MNHTPISTRLCALCTVGLFLSLLPLLHGQKDDKKAAPTERQDSAEDVSALLKQAAASQEKRDFVRARELFEQALELVKKDKGEKDANYIIILGQLGSLHRQAGNLKDAETCLHKASDLADIHKLPADPAARIWLERGRLKNQMGLPQESEGLLRGAYEAKHAEGKRDLLQAETAREYGLHFMRKGESRRARVLLEEARGILADRLGRKHVKYAAALNDLGIVHNRLGNFAGAKPLFEEAARVFRDTRGELSLDYATVLSNQGVCYHYMGELGPAKQAVQQALKIQKQLLGADHPGCAALTLELGQIACSAGDHAEAEKLLGPAIEVFKKAKQEKNIDVALRSLAKVYAATNRPREAFELYLEAMPIGQTELKSVFSYSSEAAMFDFMGTIQGSLECVIGLALACQEADPKTADHALTWTLRRKGIILEALCQLRNAERNIPTIDPNGARMLANLQRTRRELAALVLAGAQSNSPQMRVKEELYDLLQRQFHNKVSAYRKLDTQAFHDVDSQKILDKLPPNSALVEVVHVRSLNFKATGKEPMFGPYRYVALVLTHDADRPVRLVDLGLAEPIDQAVRAFREKLQQAPRELRVSDEKTVEKEFHTISSKLYELTFSRLRPAVGKAGRIYMALDGELHRVPFEALVEKDSKYLVESHEFIYLLTARDLVRPRSSPVVHQPRPPVPVKKPGKPDPLGRKPPVRVAPKGTIVFAGPSYNLNDEEREQEAKRILGEAAPKTTVAMRSADSTATRGLRWTALPGAAREAEDVKNALSESRFSPVTTYVGPQALEEVFKAIRPPVILHVATHGFFLSDEDKKNDDDPKTSDGTSRAGSAEGLAHLRRQRNPLLRSGIVLAGANKLGENGMRLDGNDGWLTAEEIAAMDLRGTELVVLSACETGLGDIRSGQGVYGLRHAFIYAGAQALLTSLFEVPDVQTRDMMKRFYESLKANPSKINALHQAQLEMIRQRRKEHEAAHPFFWASFVLVGDPANRK
jgi:CHAT domain-containing protein/Flp pilus assembly protein TadD